MKLAVVTWEDACEIDNEPWADDNTDIFEYKPLLVTQVGYVFYDGPEGIVLTDGLTEAGQVSRRSQIPRGMVRQIKYLKT